MVKITIAPVLLFLAIFQSSRTSFDLTLVNEYPIVRNNQVTTLKCVSDDTELTHDVFKRKQDTGFGSRISSYSMVGPISPENWPGKKLNLFAESGMERTGIYSCQAKDPSNILKEAVALKMSSNGKVWPKSFTYTASVNEKKVTLQFQSFDLNKPVTWLLHNQILSVTSLNYTIETVSMQHAGLYEGYQSTGDSTEHENIKHKAFIRMIVRSCQAGKWNYPQCNRFCECQNGGACNAWTGECICPPGFKGLKCENGCGGNRFGLTCQYKCKSSETGSNDENGCRGRQFCLQDPYGCSCASGYSGLECINGCANSFYGADCKQECHCKLRDVCNRFTGSCALGCAAGWEGSSCQIACSDGKWGENCEHICHCLNDVACDIIDGRCPNGRCDPPFTGINCQIDSLDECSSNPCLNGGTCNDEVLGYKCYCINGTTGINCEIDLDDCLSNPCLNEGECKDEGPYEFSCNCVEGYTGQRCEIDIDDCEQNECQNGAECVDAEANYQCICKEDYTGKFCEFKCYPGYFYDENYDACKQCEKNFYQNLPGERSCIPCPPQLVTAKKGSISVNDCNIGKKNESAWIIIAIPTGIACAAISSIAVVYHLYSGKKTRLQHLGPGKTAW